MSDSPQATLAISRSDLALDCHCGDRRSGELNSDLCLPPHGTKCTIEHEDEDDVTAIVS